MSASVCDSAVTFCRTNFTEEDKVAVKFWQENIDIIVLKVFLT